MVQQTLMKQLSLKGGIGLSASLLFSMAAHAEANPYYLGGSLGVSRVSNIYRTSGADTNSDTVTTASLLAGIDQYFGRQHLTVDGSLQENRYNINTPLNNHGYSLRSALDWSTIERISGTLSASANQQLANYNVGNNVQQVFAKNIEKDQQVQAVVRVGLVTRYSMEASLTHYSQDFSQAAYNSLVYNQNAGSLGLVYRASDLLRLGVALRHTLGEYPRYPVALSVASGAQPVVIYADDTFKRNDVDLTANWAPSGASQLNARLSWTDAVHDIAPALNYKGVTGSLGWSWQPTGKLALTTQVTRDTGNQVNLLGPSVNRVGDSIDFGARYQLTGKISLTGGISERHSSYEIADASGAKGHDNDHSYRVGATWAYSRSLSLICQANLSGRNSSIEFYNYDASAYGCTVQALMY